MKISDTDKFSVLFLILQKYWLKIFASSKLTVYNELLVSDKNQNRHNIPNPAYI